MKPLRLLAGHGLMLLCNVLDSVPCYERASGRWYRYGHWGCKWGVSQAAIAAFGEHL